MLPIACYAEIHHKRGLIPNFLWQNEPEIIADFPRRIDPSVLKIPFVLLVKDADTYPVVIKSVIIKFLFNEEKIIVPVFDGEEVITQRMWSKLYYVPRIWPYLGDIPVIVEITYYCKKRQRIVENHNYRSIKPELWYLHFAEEPLPKIDNWYNGDIHWHSSYTDDDIEFGLPLAHAKILARASGMDFLGVTDHSYDLDDVNGQPHVLDPETGKWNSLKKEISALNESSIDFALLRGEEVSCGNKKQQNVHALIFGNDDFIPGSGDSTDTMLNNKPETLITDLTGKGYIVAAHPYAPQSLLQRLVLRRGVWSDDDLDSADAIEYYNGVKDKAYEDGKKAWVRQLLKGKRLTAVAGSDAHGDFNSAFKIAIPFIKVQRCTKQIAGTARTYVLCKKQPNEAIVMDALKKGRVMISDGPVCTIVLSMHHNDYVIGDSVLHGNGSLTIEVESSNEFGTIADIYVIDAVNNSENYFFKEIGVQLPYKNTINYTSHEKQYVRLEISTTIGFMAITNPIYFKEHNS